MLKGWKTVIFGVLTALFAIVSNADMQQFVAENLPWVGGLFGTAVVVLRAVTSSGIFKKE